MEETLDVSSADTRIEAAGGDEEAHYLNELSAKRSVCSEEEREERARRMIQQNPNYRYVFLHVLAHCRDEAVELEALEEFVAGQPDYARLHQPPYFPIHWLNEAFALEELYLDGEGTLHTWDEMRLLFEDEFDDLIVAYAYRTTDIGAAMVEEFAPFRQIEVLFNDEPERAPLYRDVLCFLREKHGFVDIERFMSGRPELKTTVRGESTIKPSMFVDKLAALGCVYFDKGWELTEEGRAMLDELVQE